jgi:3-methylfumaryl-CoA hydratase
VVAESALAPEALQRYVGREETREDVVAAAPLVSLSALLDRDDPEPREGDAAPPLAHWLFFLPRYRESEAGADGHAVKGTFLPNVPLPRRMWAGSRIRFERPLRVGAAVRRRSTITDVSLKQGKSGPLVFVTARHEVSDAGGVVLVDEHDIVYRGETTLAPRHEPAPDGEAWRREIWPDPVLLFRYSAVTFNSHRIHYDQPYATGVEGYPGLVVHGPLIATLLLDLLRRHRPATDVKEYRFKATKPLYDTASFFTCGSPDEGTRTARLWTRDAEGAATMQATASW